VRLGGVIMILAVLLAALTATHQISLDGALAAWESFAAKLAAR
jgi:hypothetical protein